MGKKILNVIYFFVGILGIYALFEPIFPAVIIAIKGLWGYIFSSLYLPLDRPILTATLICIIYLWFVGLYFKRRPISVLSATLNLRFDDPRGQSVTLIREQVLRANQPKVSAYHFRLSPAPEAHISENIKAISTSHSDLSGTLHKRGGEKYGWDCSHDFSNNLPFSSLILFLPNFVLINSEKQPRYIFRKCLVVTQITATFVDDFNRPEPSFDIGTTRYTEKEIICRIHFDPQCLPTEFDARIIQENGVHKVEPRPPIPGRNYYEVTAHELINERLLISWALP